MIYYPAMLRTNIAQLVVSDCFPSLIQNIAAMKITRFQTVERGEVKNLQRKCEYLVRIM